MKSKDFYASSAWKWFSRFVMLSHAKESNGVYFVTCATSGKQMQIPSKKAHCGHLIKVFNGNSTNFATAFDERNVMPQSMAENRYKSGNELKMMMAIENYHGAGTYEELLAKSKTFYKLDKVILKDISDEYRLKFKELAKIKGDPWR